MQTEAEFRLFFRQRIIKAHADSLAALVWRGAPLLHCEEGLTGDDVVKILSQEADRAPFPVVLELIVMRQEARMQGYENRAAQVADLAIAHPHHVGYIDFAADETTYSSRSDYRFYFVDAIRYWAVRLSMGQPLVIDCHMGETIPVQDWLSELLDNIEKLLYQIASNMQAFASDKRGEIGLIAGLEKLFGKFLDNDRKRFLRVRTRFATTLTARALVWTCKKARLSS